MTDVYYTKRRVKKLVRLLCDEKLADNFFRDERLDSLEIKNCSFKHCTFSNISFKETEIIGCIFENCIFINCYFRKSDLFESKFFGCKFIECDFPRLHIRQCVFDYSNFKNCFIPYKDIKASLPKYPNIREIFARNMSVEASKTGHFNESSRYRKEELKAKEKNLLAAVKRNSQWYSEHYQGARRFKAGFQYIVSKLNGFFFGYGQYFFPLVLSFGMGLVFFWLIFYIFKNSLVNITTKKVPNALDLLFYSLHNLLPGIQTEIMAKHKLIIILAGCESLWGVILAAYIASFIFRWSLNK